MCKSVPIQDNTYTYVIRHLLESHWKQWDISTCLKLRDNSLNQGLNEFNHRELKSRIILRRFLWAGLELDSGFATIPGKVFKSTRKIQHYIIRKQNPRQNMKRAFCDWRLVCTKEMYPPLFTLPLKLVCHSGSLSEGIFVQDNTLSNIPSGVRDHIAAISCI